MNAQARPPARSRISPAELLDELSTGRTWLLVQDLDGVCMELVHDPRRRRLDPDYVRATRQLDGRFGVLTNGEHEGSRGVNRLVEQALAGTADPAVEGLYLPGLGAGGVQLQSRHGRLTHPGVSQAELSFLASAPAWLRASLGERLPALLPTAAQEHRAGLIEMTVLDNPLSPSLNLNPLMAAVGEQPGRRPQLQALALELMQALLEQAASAGLKESFFLHLAPNLGRDLTPDGVRERLMPAERSSCGTTDFQLMLRGGLKEVGLLVLINHSIHRRTGTAPLGLEFHGRDAPLDHAGLLDLCRSAIDPALMPRLVGVGDTITSQPAAAGGGWLRGGSDRGFLTLLQELGDAFGTTNRVVLVDSSGGEVDRPSLADGRLEGLSDPEDPLWIDTTMPGGPRQYIRWFRDLAARRSTEALQASTGS
ncbi:glucosylglycerol 3-phosphatase [Synechococcus sp. BA-124 BA4]|uniref:glucosylglycerol 3-phosphatase n=1 Tax=unclassified Synechococcus TaxID=2626047 RepID=UPI0018CCA3BA|nr:MULTISPECIES: glucosylglycerol 3-phosphatase [unclassified Synechococcus]MEA5398975.1 glucosylglycerol 3-phosphatase [Synechococcus sp. BA-124 BA4]QPN55567.1 glucosylglycerol 3-phosphatase [Synechococcus sp. CBW1107]CAK6690528.1 Glucosylglycerol-phosphate phosphatase [Synechococcus sp. CBW1107]